ncbi:MAG TPA: zinc-ribbon domain-containing protein [Sphingomicrobium sp.]|jgi:predicted Zn finger-like uncharacterized protein
MILTCPSCGTQYAVKEGAIPPQGRQVRCASCKHAWHQNPEGGTGSASEEPVEAAAASGDAAQGDAAPFEAAPGGETAEQDAPGGAFDEPGEPFDQGPAPDSAGFAPIDPVAPPGDALVEDAPAAATPAPPIENYTASVEAAPHQDRPSYDQQPAYDEDFSPFTMEERGARRGRSPLVTLLMVALLIAALAAAFWFLAPAAWKERVGIASSGETPLQLMMTHSDRQKLASGNELLAVSGRVINPTDERQNVPPIRAQLRSSSGKLVYSWTIAPPARSLPPGASATFNSAEVNVPAGGDELTITLGSAKT